MSAQPLSACKSQGTRPAQRSGACCVRGASVIHAAIWGRRRSTLARTPVAGVDSYGQQSENGVEQVLQCVENLTVTIGYLGCEKQQPG